MLEVSQIRFKIRKDKVYTPEEAIALLEEIELINKDDDPELRTEVLQSLSLDLSATKHMWATLAWIATFQASSGETYKQVYEKVLKKARDTRQVPQDYESVYVRNK